MECVTVVTSHCYRMYCKSGLTEQKVNRSHSQTLKGYSTFFGMGFMSFTVFESIQPIF